jgi:hypothetical protein
MRQLFSNRKGARFGGLGMSNGAPSPFGKAICMGGNELQNRLIELDKEFLTNKERACMLNAQLKEYTTQQGVIGLKVCNIQMEMGLLERKLEDIRLEKAKITDMVEGARGKKQGAKKRK